MENKNGAYTRSDCSPVELTSLQSLVANWPSSRSNLLLASIEMATVGQVRKIKGTMRWLLS